MHHLQTLWADTYHRKEVVKYAETKDYDKVLDLGAGTGLTTYEAYKSNPNATIIGIDFSENMLSMARSKYSNLEDKITFIQGDIENMDFDNNFFDVIILAYGLGCVSDINKAFTEMVRVAKSNARIVCAEMSETPEEYPIRHFIHETIIEAWIRYYWHFRDLDLLKLFENHNIKINEQKFYANHIFWSTTLLGGKIKK